MTTADPDPEAVKQLAADLREAMLHETFLDPQGRTVRRWHCVTEWEQVPKGLALVEHWDDIRTASREFMAKSFQQRAAQLRAERRLLDDEERALRRGSE